MTVEIEMFWVHDGTVTACRTQRYRGRLFQGRNPHKRTSWKLVGNYTVSPKKHVTTFSTITLTIGVRLQ